ncbi:hypothetical protein G6F56_001366 [Rhizopus delemar]|nr:hypothetical protein G6F56_001366 [Rhizopus delemar]
MLQQQKNQANTRLKISYSDAELNRLIPNESESSNSNPQLNIFNNYISDNTIGQLNLAQVHSARNVQGNKRLNNLQHQHLSNRLPQRQEKRNCRRAANENFVCSEIITDDDFKSNTASSPSDLMNKPIAYTCRIEMPELGDFSRTPPPIPNFHFAALVDSAKKTI